MAPRWCIYIAHRWRIPKIMYGLFLLELPATVGCLLLFGIADPNTYRTRLWQDGSNHGFNSNPNEILYSYANYKPIHTPLIWSTFLSRYNVVIAVLSMFILLTKSTMFVLHGFFPIISVIVHCILIAIYSVSIDFQSTPDLSNTDPQQVPHLSKNLPWYLSKGCSFASKGNHSYCMQARASFAMVCVMVFIFFLYLCAAVHSCFITRAEKNKREEEYEEEIELKNAIFAEPDPDEGLTQEEKWERNRQLFANMPKTPVTPFGRNPMGMTPRTTAFTSLTGGEPSAIGRAASTPGMQTVNLNTPVGPSRPLAFREQYGDTMVPGGQL